MLTRRVIPCLDVDAGRVVKGVSFVDIRDAGDPSALAAFYNAEGADELVFLDITASSDARNIMVEVVEKVSSEVFIPLTVGGGIRSIDNMRKMLEAGADKVSINTAAIINPQLIEECAKEFGSQCVVLAMDVKQNSDETTKRNNPSEIAEGISWQVYTHGGRKPTTLDATQWARRAAECGAGELLVTSMDADGQKTGYDNDLLSSISDSVTVPVIASGGAGALEHFYDALVYGKSDAVLAASLFHFGELRVSEVKSYLSDRGIPVRKVE
jgi:cyclase